MIETLETLGRDPEICTLMKWALTPTPLAANSPEPASWHERSKLETDLRREKLWNADLSLAPFRPDRPELVRAVLDALEFQLRKGQGSFYNPKPETEEGRALAWRYEAAFADLEKLRHEAVQGIDPERLMSEANRISASGATAENKMRSLCLTGHWSGTYRHMVEYLAREKLLMDTSDLTRAESETFEPVWRFDAIYEAVTVSGAVSKGYTYTVVEEPALLLQFPTSQLTGWLQGDGVPFGFFIKPEDLKAGRLENAWGDIVN